MEKLGFGLGLRPPHYQHILRERPAVDHFEALSENYMGISESAGGPPMKFLLKIRENYPVTLHGVSLSIGSVDEIKVDYLTKLKRLIHQTQPLLVSDHVCWTRVNGQNSHDLLPLPYTDEAVDLITANISKVQDFLGRRLYLENVSSYVEFTHSCMTEWEFITQLVKKSGCGLILDINNIYVSSVNHSFDARTYLESIPREAIGEIHLSGHSHSGGLVVDTHDHPVADEVWALYQGFTRGKPKIPTLIEWDDKIPPFEVLYAELSRAIEMNETENVS